MNEAIQLNDEQQKIIKELTERVAGLVRAAGAPITDQASLIQSGNSKVALESYVKAVQAHFTDELAPLEERVKLIKNQIASLVTPAKMALTDLVGRQRAWMAQEKARAEAETRRRQEEHNRLAAAKIEEDKRAAEAEARRKKKAAVDKIESDYLAGLFGKREYAKRLKEAGEEEKAAVEMAAAVAEEEKDKPAPTVRVAPAIPAVAGVKNQTYYFVSVHDPKQILDEIFCALPNSDGVHEASRWEFLRRFVTLDTAEIGKYAREMKNPNAVMAALPGVKAWSNG